MKTTKVFEFSGDVRIAVNVDDNKDFFAVQLEGWGPGVANITHWDKYYEGILTLTLGDRTFIYLSAYWDGNLPIEQPLEIIKSK